MDIQLTYLQQFYEKTKTMYRIPCSQDEIEKLELHIGNPLPDAYKEFLLLMGKRGQGFMTGSSFFYNKLFYLTQEAILLLKEDQSSLTLTQKSFVFAMHQGYRFLFFNLDEGPNPQVYYYWEGERNCFIPKGIFSNFITNADI